MTASDPQIISRAQWGANPLVTPAGAITTPSAELWLHHSAGEQFDAAGMRMLQNFTLHRPDAHYVDLEYTFVVDHVDLHIYESRGVGRDTAATGGWTFTPWPRRHNSISHAVCVMGNFQTDGVTGLLIYTLANLVAWGYERNWWPLGFTGGHRDASGNSTACPGDHLEAEIPTINALAQHIHAGSAPTPAPAPAPAPTPPSEDDVKLLIEANMPEGYENPFCGVELDITRQSVEPIGGAGFVPAPGAYMGNWRNAVRIGDDTDGVARVRIINDKGEKYDFRVKPRP